MAWMASGLQQAHDRGFGCVGQFPGVDMRRIFFSPWFLEIGHYEDPSCSWTYDRVRVVQSLKVEEREDYIWVLTEETNEQGWRLGVWPD